MQQARLEEPRSRKWLILGCERTDRSAKKSFKSTTYSFFMVGDDTTDKVGVGVPQGGHELGERLFVELSNGTKHALFGFVGGSEGRLTHSRHLVKADNPVH